MFFVWFLRILAISFLGLMTLYLHNTARMCRPAWDSSRDTCAVTQYAYYPLCPLAEVSSSHRCYALHSCLHHHVELRQRTDKIVDFRHSSRCNRSCVKKISKWHPIKHDLVMQYRRETTTI